MLTRPVPEHADHGCEAIRREAFAACDGELSPEAALQVEQHLAQCDSCRQRFTADATFLRVVRAAASIDAAPQSFRERLLQSLQTGATENARA
ncbi:MAG TPA: zf-HC2 domain-containing protein [Gemmatimonadaceae bacterium]|nr:zf-HC2 domain-containing protein [Gemmatimonadaceae bacterium]